MKRACAARYLINSHPLVLIHVKKTIDSRQNSLFQCVCFIIEMNFFLFGSIHSFILQTIANHGKTYLLVDLCKEKVNSVDLLTCLRESAILMWNVLKCVFYVRCARVRVCMMLTWVSLKIHFFATLIYAIKFLLLFYQANQKTSSIFTACYLDIVDKQLERMKGWKNNWNKHKLNCIHAEFI